MMDRILSRFSAKYAAACREQNAGFAFWHFIPMICGGFDFPRDMRLFNGLSLM